MNTGDKLQDSLVQIVFEVDVKRKVGDNHYFWQAAGHDFLFRMATNDAGQYLLSRINEHHSIRYLRTHFTFNNNKEKGGNVVKFHGDGTYEYDFSQVNRVFQTYVENGIKPIVEFDFFPDGFAKPFDEGINAEGFMGQHAEPRDWVEWENLLRAFMENLIDTFGREEMRLWYYEVWNEPDSWPTDRLPVFFKLYDVFAHVVKSYDESFKIGGPATFNLFALKAFLDHVDHGVNHVTGEKGAPIDFISHHIYGLSGGWLAKPPVIVPQVSRFSQEVHWIKRLIDRYEGFGEVEFHLNEWGVASNFERVQADYPQLEYRNNEFSPLFMTKLVDCLYAVEDNYDFRTSLMLYWGFSWEDEKDVMFVGNRELTTGGHTPKPILTGFEFLSKLEPDRLHVSGNTPGDRLGIIPTKSDSTVAFIVYNFNETDDDLSIQDEIKVNLTGLSSNRDYDVSVYTLSRTENNNYTRWKSLGSPSNPLELPHDWFKTTNTIQSSKATLSSDERGNIMTDIALDRHSMRLCIIKTK